jgi:hypothetical protein
MTQLCGNCGRRDGQHEMWCKGNALLETKTPTNKTEPANPLDVQVAGGHYKDKKIQPVEYIHANKLNFLEGCIVKRITRWRDKPAEHRFQDLEKIKHEVDLLIEMEKRHG